MTASNASQLRVWACGSLPVEAATELLLRAFHGRFAQPGHPWIRDGREGHWVDFAAITETSTAVYSGGERRLLLLAGSLGAGRPVDLNDTLTGIDRPTLVLVLAAAAHAGGSHLHSEFSVNDITDEVDVIDLPSLFPWPPQQAGERDESLPPHMSLRGRITTDSLASDRELDQAAHLVRRLSDRTSSLGRGHLLYDVVRAIYDSVKFTALAHPAERDELAEVVDAADRYRMAVWGRTRDSRN